MASTRSSGRTPNGRSSIYLGSDGRWHGWVTIGKRPNGEPDRRHRTGPSRTAVTAKVQELERLRDNGTAPAVADQVRTVGDWFAYYIETYCADRVAVGKMAPKTHDSYRSMTYRWIIPNLGGHLLEHLQPEHLEALYARMRRDGRAGSSVLKCHAIVSASLTVAHRRRNVRNVALLVDAPAKSATEVIPFDMDEARAILRACRTWPTGNRWAVALALGLRQGEGLGLRWSRIDLAAGTVRVDTQLQRLTWRHGCADPAACAARHHRVPCPKRCKVHHHYEGCDPASCRKKRHVCPTVTRPCPRGCVGHARACPKRRGGGLVFTDPKGSSGTVHLPPEVIPLLKRHLRQQTKQKLSAPRWHANDLLFCRADGSPVDPRRDADDWKALLAAAGVRTARVHDGRHTTATLLLLVGVSAEVVQKVLRHTDIRTTLGYAHIVDELQQAAAARYGAALWASDDGDDDGDGLFEAVGE